MPPIEISSRRKTTKKRRDALALEHLEWAHGIARRVATLLPTWFTEDDLTGPVELALLRLAEQYDRTRGAPFRAYAQRRIYGACFDAVRRKEYVERGHFSLSESTTEPNNRLGTVAMNPWTEDWLIDRRSPSQEEQACASDRIVVWARVQQLPSRHALVILAVYGGGMTLETLATKMDVGSSRLSQIHHEALRMLRGMAA